MRDFDDRDVNSLRNVVAFTVITHTLDLITTQWRDPTLTHEGNPFYQLADHLGFEGWPSLVITKVVMVGALGLAYWWYMRVRDAYLPDKLVSSPRALVWYGMWDRKPYPRSMFLRLFNRRKFAFLAVVLGGTALPGSGASALFISVDNAGVALGHALPMRLALLLLLCTVLLVFMWWYWAYWRFYTLEAEAGRIGPRDAASPAGDSGNSS